MDKINWINGQAGGTPLSAENLNQMQDNVENEFGEFIRVVWGDITLGDFNAEQDKYDQEWEIPSATIPEGYQAIGIVGYGMYGTYYSHCFFSKLILNSGQNKILWSAKNTRSGSASNIHSNVAILCMKIEN